MAANEEVVFGEEEERQQKKVYYHRLQGGRVNFCLKWRPNKFAVTKDKSGK